MKHYNIYRNLKSDLKKKKTQLADLKKQPTIDKLEIENLEAEIEEDINGINVIFNYLISLKSN